MFRTSVDRKAFKYETGQFICHTYANLHEEEQQTLGEVVRVFQDKQATYPTSSVWADWIPVYDTHDGVKPATKLHITLLRGHRAVYYHQIKSMLDTIKSECRNLEPFSLCFNKFRVFCNYESTKEFLCICDSQNNVKFSNFKRRLQEKIDLFAIKLSEEGETEDTKAHCSLMFRKLKDEKQECDESLSRMLNQLEDLCHEKLLENPICFIRVSTIQIKIGKNLYDIKLGE